MTREFLSRIKQNSERFQNFLAGQAMLTLGFTTLLAGIRISPIRKEVQLHLIKPKDDDNGFDDNGQRVPPKQTKKEIFIFHGGSGNVKVIKNGRFQVNIRAGDWQAERSKGGYAHGEIVTAEEGVIAHLHEGNKKVALEDLGIEVSFWAGNNTPRTEETEILE